MTSPGTSSEALRKVKGDRAAAAAMLYDKSIELEKKTVGSCFNRKIGMSQPPKAKPVPMKPPTVPKPKPKPKPLGAKSKPKPKQPGTKPKPKQPGTKPKPKPEPKPKPAAGALPTITAAAGALPTVTAEAGALLTVTAEAEALPTATVATSSKTKYFILAFLTAIIITGIILTIIYILNSTADETNTDTSSSSSTSTSTSTSTRTSSGSGTSTRTSSGTGTSPPAGPQIVLTSSIDVVLDGSQIIYTTSPSILSQVTVSDLTSRSGFVINEDDEGRRTLNFSLGDGAYSTIILVVNNVYLNSHGVVVECVVATSSGIFDAVGLVQGMHLEFQISPTQLDFLTADNHPTRLNPPDSAKVTQVPSHEVDAFINAVKATSITPHAVSIWYSDTATTFAYLNLNVFHEITSFVDTQENGSVGIELGFNPVNTKNQLIGLESTTASVSAYQSIFDSNTISMFTFDFGSVKLSLRSIRSQYLTFDVFSWPHSSGGQNLVIRQMGFISFTFDGSEHHTTSIRPVEILVSPYTRSASVKLDITKPVVLEYDEATSLIMDNSLKTGHGTSIDLFGYLNTAMTERHTFSFVRKGETADTVLMWGEIKN
jgi:hypothetical protein